MYYIYISNFMIWRTGTAALRCQTCIGRRARRDITGELRKSIPVVLNIKWKPQKPMISSYFQERGYIACTEGRPGLNAAFNISISSMILIILLYLLFLSTFGEHLRFLLLRQYLLSFDYNLNYSYVTYRFTIIRKKSNYYKSPLSVRFEFIECYRTKAD